MRDEGNGVGSVEPMGRGGESLVDRALCSSKSIIGLARSVLLDFGKEIAIRDLRRRFLPLNSNGVESLLRVPFCGRRRGDEVSVANNDHARQFFRSAVVERRERRTERRRTQHFAVKHPRELHIRRVLVTSSYEVATIDLGNGFAGDGPLIWRRHRIVGREAVRQGLAACEIEITERAARGGIDNFGVGCDKLIRRNVPLFRGCCNKKVACGIGDSAELGRHGRRGAAAKRASVKRGQSRVGHDHADAGEGNAQLIGDGLSQFRSNVLADLSLAGEGGHAAIFADVQPCGDVIGELFAMEAAGW